MNRVSPVGGGVPDISNRGTRGVQGISPRESGKTDTTSITSLRRLGSLKGVIAAKNINYWREIC